MSTMRGKMGADGRVYPLANGRSSNRGLSSRVCEWINTTQDDGDCIAEAANETDHDELDL